MSVVKGLCDCQGSFFLLPMSVEAFSEIETRPDVNALENSSYGTRANLERESLISVLLSVESSRYMDQAS